MEVGLKHVLVIPSSLTLAGFAKFSAPTTFDTEYNLQPLVEPCCLRVDQALLQWHESDSYASKGYKPKLEKQNIRLTAEITDYLCLFFDFQGIRWPLAFPGHVRLYILQYINEITVLLILHGYWALFWIGNTSIRQGLLTCASHFLLHTRFLRWSVIIMQIRYEMVSNAHVLQLTVSL